MVGTYFDKWHGRGDPKTRLLLVVDAVGRVRGSWYIKLVHARHREGRPRGTCSLVCYDCHYWDH